MNFSEIILNLLETRDNHVGHDNDRWQLINSGRWDCLVAGIQSKQSNGEWAVGCTHIHVIALLYWIPYYGGAFSDWLTVREVLLRPASAIEVE